MNQEKGFFLVEALIALLILSVTLVALIGVTGQALKISERGIKTTEALLGMEEILFQLESGIRVDLVKYGGRENLKGGYSFDVSDSKVLTEASNIRLLKDKSEILALNAFLQDKGQP